MGIKHERVESIISKEVTKIIQFELKDPAIGFCTITEVKVTNDFSYATIYLTFLGQKTRNDAGLNAINKSKGRIRSLLAKELTIRKVPELRFVLDDTFEKAQKIENIIAEMHK